MKLVCKLQHQQLHLATAPDIGMRATYWYELESYLFVGDLVGAQQYISKATTSNTRPNKILSHTFLGSWLCGQQLRNIKGDEQAQYEPVPLSSGRMNFSVDDTTTTQLSCISFISIKSPAA